MKLMSVCVLGIAVMFGSVAASAQEMPKPTKEHEWLKQFEGTWDWATVMTPGPGLDPIKCN